MTLIDRRRKKAVRMVFDMILSLKINDDTLACIYAFVAKGRILYDELNRKTIPWYKLNEFNIWKPAYQSCICEDITLELEPLIERAYKIICKNGEPNKKIKKSYDTAIHHIKTNSSVVSVYKRLEGKMPKEKVFEKLDKVNLYLFAFDNGVYDLENNVFRLPKPKEYITMSCGYDYMPIDKKIKKAMEYLMKVIHSCQPTKEDADTILMQVGQSLCGVPIEKFYVWLGAGGNGKGVLRDIIAMTFGEYFDSMDISYLCRSKQGISANAPDEIMARKKNSRIVMSSEPEGDASLRMGKIKELSGLDKIQVRFLQGKLFEFVPCFKMFLLTNYALDIPNAGPDIRRRAECVKFPMNFTETPTLENDRLVDTGLKEAIKKPIYKIAFFHILLDYYNQWENNGRKITLSKNIAEETAIFLNSANAFGPFFKDLIIKTGNDKDFIKLTELRKIYVKYNTGVENSNMTAPEFRKALESKGLMVKLLNGYNGIRGIKVNMDKLNERLMTTNQDEYDFLG